MGSESSSSMIMFIAAITIAAVAAAAMGSVITGMSSQLKARGDGFALAIGTDIAIVNDPENVPYDSGLDELTIYIKNTGTVTLAQDELIILVDGVNRDYTMVLLDGASQWSNGVVAEVTVSAALATGDHRIRVVQTPNIADSMDFRV